MNAQGSNDVISVKTEPKNVTCIHSSILLKPTESFFLLVVGHRKQFIISNGSIQPTEHDKSEISDKMLFPSLKLIQGGKCLAELEPKRRLDIDGFAFINKLSSCWMCMMYYVKPWRGAFRFLIHDL